MTDALCELRHNGDGTSPLAETLAKNIESRLEELLATVNAAVSRVEKSGLVNLISNMLISVYLRVLVIIFLTLYLLYATRWGYPCLAWVDQPPPSPFS